MHIKKYFGLAKLFSMSKNSAEAKRAGFTLIEIITAIAIVAILMVILIPSMQESRERANRALCANNLRQIYLGMSLFADDHEGQFPGDSNAPAPFSGIFTSAIQLFNIIYPGYVDDKNVFWCPSKKIEINTSSGTGPNGYEGRFDNPYNTNYMGFKNLSPESGAKIPLAQDDARGYGPDTNLGPKWDSDSNHKGAGGNVLFCDGHVKWHKTPAPFLNNVLFGWYINR